MKMWNEVFLPLLRGMGEALFYEGGIYWLAPIFVGLIYLLSRFRRSRSKKNRTIFITADDLLALHLRDTDKHPSARL